MSLPEKRPTKKRFFFKNASPVEERYAWIMDGWTTGALHIVPVLLPLDGQGWVGNHDAVEWRRGAERDRPARRRWLIRARPLAQQLINDFRQAQHMPFPGSGSLAFLFQSPALNAASGPEVLRSFVFFWAVHTKYR